MGNTDYFESIPVLGSMPTNANYQLHDWLDAGTGTISNFTSKNFTNKIALIYLDGAEYPETLLERAIASNTYAVIFYFNPYSNKITDYYFPLAYDIEIPSAAIATNDITTLFEYTQINQPISLYLNISLVTNITDADKVPYFSSQGPSFDEFYAIGIKPEIVAPGYDICAALTYNGVFPKYERACGQGHTPLSGTSMATPHVSGASALLKQAHPDWGNKEIKSALMVSSTSLGENPNIFGAGRINVTSALHPRIYLSEPTLNFGHIEFNDEKLITFTIKNLFTNQTVLNLNFSSVDSNVQLIVSPNVANLNPNEEEQVTVHLKYLHDEPPYLTALTNYLTIQGDANAKIPLLYYKTTNKSIVGFTQDPGEISSSLVPFFKTIKLSDINNDEHIEMLGGSSVLYSFNDFENNISNYDILYAPPCIDQGIYCYADSIDAIAVEDFNHDGDKEILVGGTQGYLRLLGKNYNPKNLTKTIVGSENFTFGDYNFTTSINQYNQLIIFARNVDNPLLVAFFNLRISENEYDSEYGYIENIIFHLVSLQNGIAIVKLQENGYKPTLLNKFREQLWAMDSADFNNDGWQDVVFSYSPLPRVLNISILFNDGHGNLNNLYTIYTSGDQISGLTAGDVDNDGFKDVVVGYSTAFSRFNVYGVTKLLKNDGNNQFYDGGVISAYGTGTPFHPENDINPRVVLSDLDNDGNLELVIGDNSGKIRILKKDSTGKYNEDLLVNKGLLFDFGRLSWGVAANDINNDGKIDLVIASGLRYYYNAFLLYTKLNNGDFITPAPVRPKSQIINNGTSDITGYLYMGIEKLSGISVSASDIKKLGNENFLEIGEAINAPQPVLNQNDLISLSNGTFMNARGIFPYTQELTLPSAKTVFAVDSGQSEDPSMYLKFNSNEPAYIYNLRFNPALESEVNENLELKDLTGHRLNLFAKEFTIISAKNESDRLTLKLFHASLVDVLQEGETETYSYNGNDYEITASYISTSGALFTVNGRTTDRLIEGDIYTLADGTNIGVIDITNNSENGMDVVEFGLGSESLKITDYHPLTANWDAEVAYGNEDLNNVKADIIVTSFSNGITKIRELRFKYLPSSDLFVPMSGELSTTAYDEEGEDGNVLVNGFDIEFKGIDEEDNLWEKIEIERAADFSYRLSFENRNGDLYEIPVWSYDNLTNSIKLGYNADSFKKLVITEGTSILDEEIFVLSNDAAKKTHFFQFKSVNTNDQTFKIKDLMENGATIEANNASAFIFDGTAYYAYYTGSGSNARLYIDLNGDGTIQQGQRADRLYTKYSDSDGYIQLIPDNVSINASGIFLTEKTQNMPSNNFQEQIKWKFYFDSSLNKLMLSNPVNDFGSFSPMKKMSSLDKYIGITYYGADGEYDYTNSDSPSLKFNYPDKQLEMWINVVGNMPEQTSHSFWQPYRIVIEDLQPRTVPANNVQALDIIWNEYYVNINESGQYRVVGEFRDSYSGQPIQTTAGYLRDEWEFNVSEAVSPTPLKLNVTITNPLNNSIVNSNPVVFSATTSKIAYCNIMYKEYLNNYSVGGAGPMFSSNKLQHSSSLSFHQGGHVVANVNCISAVNQSEYANANIEFSVNFIDICGNNFCNADAGETPENCPIDCRHVDYPEYCQQNNMGNNVGSNNEQGNSGNSLSIAAKTNFDTLSNETLKKIVVQGDIQKFKSLGLSIQMNSPGIFSITSKFQRIDVMQQKLPEVAALRDIEGNEFIVNLAAVFNEQYAKGYIVEFDGLSIVEYQKQLESDIQGMKIQADLLKQKIDARTGTSKIFNIIDVPRLSIAKNSINNAEIQLPNKISEHKNELKTNIASFREEISKIDKSINETSKVKEEYKMVFNGVFLDASAKTAMEIEDMKGVKSIRAYKKNAIMLC